MKESMLPELFEKLPKEVRRHLWAQQGQIPETILQFRGTLMNVINMERDIDDVPEPSKLVENSTGSKPQWRNPRPQWRNPRGWNYGHHRNLSKRDLQQ